MFIVAQILCPKHGARMDPHDKVLLGQTLSLTLLTFASPFYGINLCFDMYINKPNITNQRPKFFDECNVWHLGFGSDVVSFPDWHVGRGTWLGQMCLGSAALGGFWIWLLWCALYCTGVLYLDKLTYKDWPVARWVAGCWTTCAASEAPDTLHNWLPLDQQHHHPGTLCHWNQYHRLKYILLHYRYWAVVYCGTKWVKVSIQIPVFTVCTCVKCTSPLSKIYLCIFRI